MWVSCSLRNGSSSHQRHSFISTDVPWTVNSYGDNVNFANYCLLFCYFKQYHCSVSQMWWLHCSVSFLGDKLEELRAHGLRSLSQRKVVGSDGCVYFLPECFQYQFLKLCPLFWEPKAAINVVRKWQFGTLMGGSLCIYSCVLFEHLKLQWWSLWWKLSIQWRSSRRQDHEVIEEIKCKQVISMSKLYKNPVLWMKRCAMGAQRRDTTPSSF